MIGKILILDGYSHDKTRLILKGYENKPKFKIFYREKRYDISSDFNFLVEQSKAKYCWFISGDDMISGLPKEDIFSKDYDLVITRHFECNESLQKLYSYPVLNVNKDREFLNSLDYLKSIKTSEGLFTYLSTPIFKREIWKNENIMKFKYWVVSLNLVWLLNLKKIKIFYYDTPIIFRRGGNDNFFENNPIERIKISTINFIEMINYIMNNNLINNIAIKTINFDFPLNRLIKFKYFFLKKKKIKINDFYDAIKPITNNSYFQFKYYIIKIIPIFLIGFLIKSNK